MRIKKRKYYIRSAKIPQTFNGFRIIQISDLHNALVGDSFYEKIGHPDIIVVTGDLMDARKQKLDCLGVLKRLAEIAPVYYVTGNHEATSLAHFFVIEHNVADNIKIMHDESLNLIRGEEKIQLIGLDDLKYHIILHGIDKNEPDDRLANFDMSAYSIVLLHSPNNIQRIAQYHPDLVLSGHTHGGQIRFPGIGAIYASGQGLFPKYTKGVYHVQNTDLIVSAGLGCSRINMRLFCPPEIVEIELCPLLYNNVK